MSQMTVQDLNATHTGRRVSIQDRDVTIAGPLGSVHVDQDWIAEQTLTDPEPTYTPGHKTISVSVGRWTSGPLLPDTPVEVS